MSRCTGGAFVCANSASLSGHGPFWRALAHALVFAAGKVFGGLGRWRVHGRLSEAISVISTSSRVTGEEGREENWVRETMGRMVIYRNLTRVLAPEYSHAMSLL